MSKALTTRSDFRKKNSEKESLHDDDGHYWPVTDEIFRNMLYPISWPNMSLKDKINLSVLVGRHSNL